MPVWHFILYALLALAVMATVVAIIYGIWQQAVVDRRDSTP